MIALIREPAVAGRFYPAEPDRLKAVVTRCLGERAPEPNLARMVMAPHAGYVYSGAIAGETYARVSVPPSAMVMCPNHTGLGVARSVWPSGRWRFPGFSLVVDEELAALVRERAELVEDRQAHFREHAAEVQMPFLQALRPDVTIVPICFGRLDWSECDRIGRGIASAIRTHEQQKGTRVLLVASTDMSHYVSADEARELDTLALQSVLGLDPEGLYAVVTEKDISMCGYIPTTVALVAAAELGATRAELVRYGSSGEVSGDYARVVGYAGVIVS